MLLGVAVGAAVGQSTAAVLSTNLAQAEAVITSDTLVDVDTSPRPCVSSTPGL
ncbi:hypothetical protein EV643_113249 [Kribbella sp. VKM Ac-2527]|uniref:Uncharacterized protein n=1 Tax=Kribbella caucasensis TaxID=2512215 RepID=A0A4R6K7N8_9ACTN|nr:hypothetical protein [Kribbella sp. VKM Ac-2527]TDO45476.1 hypothetical protein EV643_113249 [Kribbella sp. VKM Ac-2527]